MKTDDFETREIKRARHLVLLPSTPPNLTMRKHWLPCTWKRFVSTKPTRPTAAPLLLVAEQAGQVIGFTENWLSEMKASWFPDGRYAYLNSVGVVKRRAGRGSAVC